MGKPLQVLIVEDSEDDALFVLNALREGGYDPSFERVETAESMLSALRKQPWDIVLSDYNLPHFDGPSALRLMKDAGLDIPVIIVSGAIGEETAVESMRAGAYDYIMKDRLQRLVPAVERELKEVIVRKERMQALEELKTSKAQLSSAVEIAHLAYWEYDVLNDLFIFNDQFYKIFRTTAREQGGYTMKSAEYARRFLHPDDIELVGKETQAAVATKDPGFHRHIEHKMLYSDGTTGEIAVRFFIVKDAQGRTVRTYGVNQDITERKRAELALRESEKKYRQLAENIVDVVWTSDLDFNITYVSPSLERMIGESVDAYRARKTEDKFPPASLKRFRSALAEELEKEKDPKSDKNRSRLIEVEHFRTDGTLFWVSMNVSFARDEKGGIIGLQGISRDITERKRTEEEILRNEARLEGLLRIARYHAESTQDLLDFALGEAIRLTGSKLGYIYFYDDQKKEFQLNSWSREVMKECAIRDTPQIYQLDQTGIWGEAVRQAKPIVINDSQSPDPLKKGFAEGHAPLSKYLTVPIMNNDRIVAVAGVANKETDYDESDVRQLTLLMDAVWRITEEKKSAEALLRSEGKYRNIVDNAQEGIYQATAEGKYLMVNQALALMLGYASPAEFMSSVTDIAHQVYFDPEDRARLQKQVGELGSVKEFECRFRRKDGSPMWVSVNQHAVCDKDSRVLLYEGFCEDITERRLNVERLRTALGATVYAISAAVEAKDPYTAGHQSRVADLALAIATEMGLPGDRIEGLRLAAKIHDLGKLSVPSEILTKPTRLLDVEFSLIKIHSQAGYDILKDIEFPWPIARMVLEHHERMDGSGYPNGLSGERILLESRILSVADVVESMASYRPYRPALGIDAALAEIENHRGTLYDAEVVDSCLRLFRERGFKLE